jgi:UDP-glucose 4-epimerase
MKIGFAGGKGTIGSHLIRYLSDKNTREMRAIVRSLSPMQENSMRHVAITYGDLRSLSDCTTFVSGLGTVFYFAHANSPITSDLDFPSDAALNLLPLLTFIQAIRSTGDHPHIVYFSSGGAVYGPSSTRVPFRESDVCQPTSSYGVQKLAAEHYLRLAALKGILTATVLRVSNAYGVLLSNQRLQGLIGVTVNNLLHGRPARVFGNPDNVRDYVHLDDICRACEAVVQPREAFAVYNIGSGVGHSVKEVLHIIEEYVEVRSPWEMPSAVDGANCLADWVVLDIMKAKQELNWNPHVALSTGIAKLVEQARADL